MKREKPLKPLVFSGLVVSLSGLYWLILQRIRRLEAEYPPVGNFVTVEGMRLHYICKGEGRPVVMLHGSSGFLQDYVMTIFDQVSEDYKACAFDRPGHVYSERPEGETVTPTVQARLIRGALRELGIEKPVLVGHSWSGALLLAYALEYPGEVSGLVLLGVAAYEDEKFSQPTGIRAVLANLERLALDPPLVPAPLKRSVSRALSAGPLEQSLVRAYSPDLVPQDYLEAAKVLWPMGDVSASVEEIVTLNPTFRQLNSFYGEIQVPVTIVTGDSDLLSEPERHAYPLHRTIPGSRLVVLENTGHEIPHTRPKETLKAIHDTWKRSAEQLAKN